MPRIKVFSPGAVSCCLCRGAVVKPEDSAFYAGDDGVMRLVHEHCAKLDWEGRHGPNARTLQVKMECPKCY